jgi:hypothetical protein
VSEVVLEVRQPSGWHRVGSVSELEPPGSLHSEEPDGYRYVYLFGWWQDTPGVWISVGGVDVGNDAVREISTVGLRQLADLSEGPYGLEVFRRPVAKYFRFDVRFRLEAST